MEPQALLGKAKAQRAMSKVKWANWGFKLVKSVLLPTKSRVKLKVSGLAV